MKQTKLIALDWGTSSFRAYRLGDNGEVLEKRPLPWGIMNLPATPGDLDPKAGFNKAFEEACGDWLDAEPGTPVIAAGMVGSAQGWKEASYLEVPLSAADIGTQLTSVTTARGTTLHIIPGMLERSALPNVIRGEETQVIGILDDGETADEILIGLPGTHSKWVYVQPTTQRITHFDTFMTGEVFAALSKHTILGRTMQVDGDTSDAAFLRGAKVGGSDEGRAGILSNIFSSRTLGLIGELNGAEQAEYLSGLLIGHEIAAIRAKTDVKTPIILIGNDKLCQRYLQTLLFYGLENVRISAQATERGLWKLAQQANLVS
jgi:2-dehydro-3-deoxygalactonokinase